MKYLKVIALVILISVCRRVPAEDASENIRVKGVLSVGATLKEGADKNSRPQDDENWKLAGASILVDGRSVQLDWSRAERIRDELFWWRLLRHGDARQIQADVTGHIKFVPVADFQRDRIVVNGFIDLGTQETAPTASGVAVPQLVVPGISATGFENPELPLTPPGKIAVIVIESLKVELVGADGQPRGTQPFRPRVTVEKAIE